MGPVQVLVGYLADRLRLVDYIERHPAVLEEKLEVGGIIIGLPRGGSTLLQRLLTTSPQLTSTWFWKASRRCRLPTRNLATRCNARRSAAKPRP